MIIMIDAKTRRASNPWDRDCLHLVNLFHSLIGRNEKDYARQLPLKIPITARYIRFLPMEWHNHVSMRIEIYGCPGRYIPHMQFYLTRFCFYLQLAFSSLIRWSMSLETLLDCKSSKIEESRSQWKYRKKIAVEDNFISLHEGLKSRQLLQYLYGRNFNYYLLITWL